MGFKIDFMRQRRVAVALSVLLVVASLVPLAWNGLQFGLDFTGGTLIELRLAEPAAPEQVREALVARGYPNAVVQRLGSERDLVARIPPNAAAAESDTATDASLLTDRIAAALLETYPGAEIRRAEFVGPVVGEDLRERGGLALLAALLGISVYILWRFSGKFAIAAALALVHDVVITLGAFALFRWQFDLATLASVLTVLGYSLNDTIVVCDRIRENLRRHRALDLIAVINLSLNQTLERTLIMSGTTLMVLIGMLVYGGEGLRGFASALTIGVVVGTWSSVYVAAAWLIHAGLDRSELMLEVPEDGARAADPGAQRQIRERSG